MIYSASICVTLEEYDGHRWQIQRMSVHLECGVNFFQILKLCTSLFAREGDVWGIVCYFKLRIMLWLSHCSTVCNNMLYWAVLKRYSGVLMRPFEGWNATNPHIIKTDLLYDVSFWMTRFDLEINIRYARGKGNCGARWRHQMETFSALLAICAHTKASDAELWCLLWSAPG